MFSVLSLFTLAVTGVIRRWPWLLRFAVYGSLLCLLHAVLQDFTLWSVAAAALSSTALLVYIAYLAGRHGSSGNQPKALAAELVPRQATTP